MSEFEDRLAVVARMQVSLLELVQRSLLDVVAARKHLEERIDELSQSEQRITEQHEAAVAAGEEQAELLADQATRTRQRITELREDLNGLLGAEELLSSRSALMQDQIADFRNVMAVISAKVVAARTSAVAAEALDALRDAVTYVELVVDQSRYPARFERPKTNTNARSSRSQTIHQPQPSEPPASGPARPAPEPPTAPAGD